MGLKTKFGQLTTVATLAMLASNNFLQFIDNVAEGMGKGSYRLLVIVVVLALGFMDSKLVKRLQ